MAVKAFRFGSIGIDTLTGVKSLSAETSAGGPNYMTFETPIGTDYQVTSGTTFYITKVDFSTGTAGNEFAIGYGNSGVADGTTSPTNLVLMTGDFIAAAGNTLYALETFIPIPQQKYPCMSEPSGTGKVTVILYGVEVA